MEILVNRAVAILVALTAPLTVQAQHSYAHTEATSSNSKSSKSSKKLDKSKLKIGDGKLTTSKPKRGYVYSCQSLSGSSRITGPWINGSTWSLYDKPTVSGSVKWSNASYKVTRTDSQRKLKGNGLPDHSTGKFPVSSSDDAYRYDRNPNSIGKQTVNIQLSKNPKKASKASCVQMGMIGVLDTGAALYNALDADGGDAVAHEIQDSCSGHPDQSSQYHYHSLPSCISTGSSKSHSNRIGWALDGFPIYGPRGKNGKYMRNSDLDACHGHEHTVKVDGKAKKMYHYHATVEYPYTIACFKGKAQRVEPTRGGSGAPPRGGPPPRFR